MKKRAIYPGSFDPVTNGHIDIVTRASNIFDEICIGVTQNQDKTSLFTIEERIALLQTCFESNSKIIIESFNGLLVDFAQSKKINTIIRGLRAVSDFDFEFQMSLTNRKLYNQLDTVFLMTDAKYSYLSSSLVKKLAFYKGDVSIFVPECVEDALKKGHHNE
ncbi:pantetheine-phosphate adenylyltransferase [Candidatus Marinamargulisbacteria bacterium SCGC AG-410-N11]|nr:pantetheine-phosphate adenylyltransferase [Candidatus Marinamargulisbacteria bacterium SCGC AG-410-N11]